MPTYGKVALYTQQSADVCRGGVWVRVRLSRDRVRVRVRVRAVIDICNCRVYEASRPLPVCKVWWKLQLNCDL